MAKNILFTIILNLALPMAAFAGDFTRLNGTVCIGNCAPPIPPTQGIRDLSLNLSAYSHLDPTGLVPRDLLRDALAAYQSKANILERPDVLTVIDYGKNSAKERFFIIDMKTGKVDALHVAHGQGSDEDPTRKRNTGNAVRFGNTEHSHMTSLGAFVTAGTYTGKHGESLILKGLSPTNSNAEERKIVIHGAAYVSDSDRVQGRSHGCPALSNAKIKKVIKEIRGGSLIYAGISQPTLVASR